MSAVKPVAGNAAISRFHLLLLTLWASSALVLLAVAAFQSAPGYMDAEYYFAGGRSLATGKGFSEPFVWNYLSEPDRLPQPSHQYWMPLASIVAALGIRLSGAGAFAASRWPFLFIAAWVPVGTALLARRLAAREDSDGLRPAVLAGLFALFPAFYLPFLTTSDTFGIYMVLGLGFLLAVGKVTAPGRGRYGLYTLLGALSGAMHLARTDGLLWLLIAYLVLLVRERQEPGGTRDAPASGRWFPKLISGGLFVSLGYLLIMGPWYIRNLTALGSLLSPGGGRLLWLTDYDELYAYPAGRLTFTRWWAGGLRAILQARMWALGQNLQTAIAVQGSIILAPLAVLGAWRLRFDRRVQVGALAWLLTFLVMTFVFPFAGARGGFFHSGAAVQPLLWALAPFGLQEFISWGGRLRGWRPQQAGLVFRIGLVGILIVLNAFLVSSRVIGEDWQRPVWSAGYRYYSALEAELQGLGARPSDLVMVNNPPGFYLAAGRPAIAVPDGDEAALHAAAERFSATYLILDENHPEGISNLYENPGGRDGLTYLGSFEDARIFLIAGSGS